MEDGNETPQVLQQYVLKFEHVCMTVCSLLGQKIAPDTVYDIYDLIEYL